MTKGLKIFRLESPMRTAQTFRIPPGMSLLQQKDYCLTILQKTHEELIALRKAFSMCSSHHDPSSDLVNAWRNKYQKEHEEKEKFKKENEKLRRENEKLQRKLKTKTKTNHRLLQALFLHGNFKKKTPGKGKSGGQFGHKDTNQDKKRDYSSFSKKRVYAQQCGNCGNKLNRVQGFKKKTFIDIQINTNVIKLLLESERQWCSNCHKEVTARYPQALPFTEYGINTFMIIMLQRFRGNGSTQTVADVLLYGFGLKLSTSVILSILEQAKKYLQGKYDELIEAVRKGEIMYADETGWQIKGEKAYMWLMATADTKHNGEVIPGKTVFVPAETRGKGIFESMYGDSKAFCMHDGYSTYESVTGETYCLYCWAHVIRYAFEETVNLPSEHTACQIRDKLVDLYLSIREHTRWSKKKKEHYLRKEFASILARESSDETVNNIQHRLQTQKRGLILALLLTEDGTNNLAEREFRKLVISRYISHGSASFEGMVTTAVLGSILQTLHRDKTSPFLSTLNSHLTDGIQKKYPQYKHPPSFAP